MKLIIANGRGDYRDLDGHMFVCAKSKADAVRLLVQAGHTCMTINEFNKYWSEGCWGVWMKGVTEERGVWFVPKDKEIDAGNGEFKPIRLV